MSEEEGKAVARRWMDDVLNGRNVDLGDELLAPDVVDHFHPGPPRLFLPFVEGAFPDFHFATDDLFAGEGDRVVVRFTFTGTHSGDSLGVPATGKKITASGIAIMRVVNGKIAEFWESADLMQQIRAAAD